VDLLDEVIWVNPGYLEHPLLAVVHDVISVELHRVHELLVVDLVAFSSTHLFPFIGQCCNVTSTRVKRESYTCMP